MPLLHLVLLSHTFLFTTDSTDLIPKWSQNFVAGGDGSFYSLYGGLLYDY